MASRPLESLRLDPESPALDKSLIILLMNGYTWVSLRSLPALLASPISPLARGSGLSTLSTLQASLCGRPRVPLNSLGCRQSHTCLQPLHTHRQIVLKADPQQRAGSPYTAAEALEFVCQVRPSLC